MQMIPLCNRCHNRITVKDLELGCDVFIGCKEESRIKDGNDAKLLCPVLIQLAKENEDVE